MRAVNFEKYDDDLSVDVETADMNSDENSDLEHNNDNYDDDDDYNYD